MWAATVLTVSKTWNIFPRCNFQNGNNEGKCHSVSTRFEPRTTQIYVLNQSRHNTGTSINVTHVTQHQQTHYYWYFHQRDSRHTTPTEALLVVLPSTWLTSHHTNRRTTTGTSINVTHVTPHQHTHYFIIYEYYDLNRSYMLVYILWESTQKLL